MKKELTKFAQTAALGLALALTFSCSSDDLGEDEAKITAKAGVTGIRFSNSSRKYEVTVRIAKTTKTLSAYSGSGEYPHYNYNASNETTHTVYYSPSSNVQVNGANTNQILFYSTK